MITLVDSVRINNDQSHQTPAGLFYFEQRNEGFAENDGKWLVTQMAELYWSPGGVLRQRRPEKFLGVFLTPADAIEATEAAELQPIEDRMIR